MASTKLGVALVFSIIGILSPCLLAQNNLVSEEILDRMNRLENKLDAILKHLSIEGATTDKSKIPSLRIFL